MKKISLVFILAIACALLVCVNGVASATTYYVPDDFVKIQWAVDNASAGDTIIVRAGTYTESIIVDKSVTLRARNTTYDVTVNAASKDAIIVSANNVNISWLKVQGPGLYDKAGIKIDTVGYANISNNWLTSNT